MTKKQKAIVQALHTGKSPLEIARKLGITRQNVYVTCARMRTAGKLPKKAKSPLTEMQRVVLMCYAGNVPIPTIAKSLGITCQTVMTHATQGFARLGFTQRGEDRVAKLREFFRVQPTPPDMSDPAFN